ncbi:hypothetical protein UA08_02816 [Talaromyces atroroseus]|uniref:N-acetyltransferase domain-containing protein n=1 Tax=Talaromyces atroroseus TaxID=1441469 RepID=A0A225B741_TALAT|nr:hypothetical protein UA08_02816 [Talaromyces atroroseus]OKL61737.1 hypothetical protein UA08_02816 [Talaromyces atroroseus]
MNEAWKIEQCTVADASALARNNISAFWEDPNWILSWSKDMPLEYLIEQSEKRQANNLLRSREDRRHIKAIDPATGKLVGYARWVLPSSHVTAPDGSPEWVQAQVPDVEEVEKKRLQELAASAWWEPRADVGEIDVPVTAIKNRHLASRPYICMILAFRPFSPSPDSNMDLFFYLLALDYLAVHPDNKGKGIATALVESGVKYAKSVGIPIFVLAFKAGVGVYSRLGFREVERLIQDDSKYGGPGEYGSYFMVYDVAPKV